MPERVIKMYADYLNNVAAIANDRKGYRHLMSYLKKIAKCDGGKPVAEDIVVSWKQEYKHKSAMMDELRKAGF